MCAWRGQPCQKTKQSTKAAQKLQQEAGTLRAIVNKHERRFRATDHKIRGMDNILKAEFDAIEALVGDTRVAVGFVWQRNLKCARFFLVCV